jgi:Protein of unknown function (DUF3572)
MARVNRLDRAAAEQVAIQALGYLAHEPEQLARLLALSGLDPQTIRTAAGDPRFLNGILDYVVADEALLVAFAVDAGIPPERVVMARNMLSGGAWERDVP